MVQAVASRTEQRAQQFIDECQAEVPFATSPAAVGTYAGLLERDDVDAVYVPIPTGMRKEWVIRAAEAGKHVMCEKPCGCNSADVEEMIQACQANNVQFMDGVMFMHNDRLAKMREVIDDGESIGKLKRVTSHHCFAAPEEFLQNNIRMHSDLEPLGAMGDVGWYNIRFTQFAMNWAKPKTVRGQMLTEFQKDGSPLPVPMEMSGEMDYGDGVSASMYCSFLTENQQWAVIGGSKGFIHVWDYVLPYFGSQLKFDVSAARFVVNGCQFNMESRVTHYAVDEYANSTPCSQESKLFAKFSSIVLSGERESFWPKIALETQQIMDAIVESSRHDGAAVELS